MFRFTIRELFLLTVIAALVVAWWVERRSLRRLADELRSQNKKLEKQLAVAATESGMRKQTLETLVLENSRMDEQLRKRQLLDEAKPGVYYLGPLDPLKSRAAPSGRR